MRNAALVSVPSLVADARDVAAAAADRAGVACDEVEAMDDLRAVSDLWASVWGRNDEGVPIGSEVLRSLVHADGAVIVARDGRGQLVGAAALTRAAGDATYSLIAAAAPGISDRGIGLALKLRQRAWALDRGLTSMRWTFDPLVGRNARFNLVKLGATTDDYLVAFYGQMADRINAGDESDRLVAHWALGSERAVSAGRGTAIEPPEPDPTRSQVVLTGPDGDPAFLEDTDGAWCRVPRDVVALRAVDPDAVAGWRALVRQGLTDAFGSGLTATGMTRSGWYRLTREGDS